TASRAIAAHCASSVTSTASGEAVPPSAVIISTVRLARPSSRSTTSTRVPLRASRMQVARPLPMPSPAAPPPVTMATRPASPGSSSGRAVVLALMAAPFVEWSREPRAGHVHEDALDAAVAPVRDRGAAAGAGADVEGAAIGSAQHAGEGVATRPDRDPAVDRAALADAQEVRAPRVGDPDRALRVEADAVGEDAVEGGPDPAAGEPPVRGHLEGGEAMGERLGHHERAAVGRDHPAVGELEVLRGAGDGAVGIDAGEGRRARRLVAVTVEAEVADVGPAARVQ